MNRWTLSAALALGACAAVSCMVYGPDDLNGAGQSGAGPGGGGSGRGGAGMGAVAGHAGELVSGGATSGEGGMPTGNRGGNATGGQPEGGAGEGGEVGGIPTGGTMGGSGVSGASGAGATGGAPVVDRTILDDMEDGNHRIKHIQDPAGGIYRNGYWYTYSVGKAVELVPAAGAEFNMDPYSETAPGPGEIAGPEQNSYGLRLYVKQVAEGTGNGAAAAFNLLDPKAVYDASKYVGISFLLRGSKSFKFRVQLATKNTDATSGVCTPASKCSDHYFIEQTASTNWTKIDAYWDERGEFAQEGWGTPVPFVAAELISVQFFVPAAATNPEVEVWLDNVTFIAP